MRLIDADALRIVFTEKSSEAVCGMELCKAIISRIDEAPTVDAVPVRHGKWIWKGEEGDSRFMCSACLWKEYVPTCNGVPNIWNYCPSCGARMDKDETD